MSNIAELLYQAHHLKRIQRTGYQFLGPGQESVAEHSYSTTFIAYVMSQLEPDVDGLKLIAMCLLHDLPESRTGDLNYVQKRYLATDDSRALKDTTAGIPFGADMARLIDEFESGYSVEAKLAKDADQLSFIIELRSLADMGYATPDTWLPNVVGRLTTPTGRKIAAELIKTPWDSWWRNLFRTADNQSKAPSSKEGSDGCNSR
jgi:putative hydrolase of HD superfamily